MARDIFMMAFTVLVKLQNISHLMLIPEKVIARWHLNVKRPSVTNCLAYTALLRYLRQRRTQVEKNT